MDLGTIIGIVFVAFDRRSSYGVGRWFPVGIICQTRSDPLTLVGSIAATTATTSLKNILKFPKYLMLAIKEDHYGAEEAIETLAKMADKARREGLLALEEESKKIKDPFLQKGIMLVVDGVDPAQVRSILQTQIEHMEERHAVGIRIFTTAGGFSPTFGIIGTVMGLITVLKELDNPSKLASSIASAFLATLWGLLSANMIFLPIAGKLKHKDNEEVAFRNLLLEGILSLQAGENPRIVREKLQAFLPPTAVAKAASTSAKKEKAKA